MKKNACSNGSAMAFAVAAHLEPEILVVDEVLQGWRAPGFKCFRVRAGEHWLAIRVSDEHGNARYITTPITAGEK